MISYVILHYNTIDDTVNCINSIVKTQEKGSYQIVIVDNNSPNGSGEFLLKKYEKESYIHIILNKQNLGFAKGNNIGFIYAKKSLLADFIVVLNSDVIILQKTFQEKIVSEYWHNKYAVLGPKINTPSGYEYSNPGSHNLPSITSLYIYILKIRFLLFLNFLHLDLTYKRFKKKFIKGEKKDVNNKDKVCDVQLHGCCWIFSPLFIKKFDGINDRTFLYREEELLFLLLKKSKLKSIYIPNIEVFHNEHSATNSITTNMFKKARFQYKQYIKSTSILIEELKRYKR